MMKSFFKKLAFVMALAMVVSLAAPAGSALAADYSLNVTVQGTKVAIKEYNLEKVGDTVDFQFWKAPSNWADDYEWDYTVPGIVAVDKAGVVTALAEGTTTVTITVLDQYYGAVEVTVGEKVVEVEPTVAPTVEPTVAPTVEPTVAPTVEPTVAPTEAPVVEFKAEQTKDNAAKITLPNKEVTKEALEDKLVFYYYVGDYQVIYPIKVSEVKDGIATVESYFTFTDGTKYGFEFAGNTSEFTAVIGDVAEIIVKYDCDGDAKTMEAYLGEDTKITATLLNAKGIDITASAVDGVDKYIKYTLVEEAAEGEFYIPDERVGAIRFDGDKVAMAKVKVEYVTGKFDENYEAVPGAYKTIDIVSQKAPAYGIDTTKKAVGTIVDSNNTKADFSKANTVIALGDEYGAMSNARLVAQLIDTKGKKVTTDDTLTNGAYFEFESTNKAIAYVDNGGYIMTNSTGEVYVLIHYICDNTDTVVGVVTLNVKEARAVKTLDLDKNSAVISTEAGVDKFNETSFKVTLKDQLGAKKEGTVKVECLTKLPNGATAAPTVSVEEATAVGGELTFKVTGDVANLPVANNKVATTYSYTYKVSCGNVSKQFTVRVNKPDADGKVQGVEIAFNGGTDLKTADDNAKNVNITVYTLSNGVRNGVLELAPKCDKSKAIAGNYYYTITKDGKDVTGTTTGDAISVGLTTIETKSNIGGTASGSSLNVVKKTATGTYTVTVYQASGEAGKTATGFVSKKTNSFTVTDTQDKMTFAGRADGGDSFTVAEGSTVEDVVKTCFNFKVGSNKVDYTKTQVVANANVANNGVLAAGYGCFIKSVDFYVLVGSNTYVKYTVNVNSYVELK